MGTVATATALTVTAIGTAGASDTLPWTGDSAVGENQPYQHGYTAVDLLRWDPSADLDAPLLRARVPLQQRIDANPDTQLHPHLPASTQLHTLAGDYGNAFFESHHDTNEFSQYLFGFWQYADIYGPWHGMPTAGIPPQWWDPDLEWHQRWFEFGMLNLPNPAYTNAAHANGVISLGTIFFSDNDRGEQTFTDLLVKDDDGAFPVAAKLVEVAEYFGFDGYFINQEEVSARLTAEQIADYRAFLQQLRDDGMYIQWYDSVTDAGTISYQNEFNANNSPWVLDPDAGRVSDSIFLNYWWNPSRLTSSRDHAVSLGLDPHEVVFAGVEAGMYQFDQPYDLQHNLDADGVPMNSIATLGADFVHANLGDDPDDGGDKTVDDDQWLALDRERRWWTGSSTGDGTPEGDWQGISSYIAERSVIGGTTFATTFNTGHGLEWRVDGEVSSNQEWGNINVQDIPVTWQWWIEAESETLGADYDHGPDYVSAPRFGYTPVGAWQGGSSLVLSGDLTSDTTVRLFQTDLSITADSEVEITWRKDSASDDSELRLGIVLASEPEDVVELPIAGSGARTDGWRTDTLDLSAYQGESIATLAVVVAGGEEPIEDFQVNLGALRVTDGADATPAVPTGLTVEQLYAGTGEMIVSWDLADYEEVRSYELYLDGEYLGGRYDELYYVKDLPAVAGELQLRAVGHDGTVSDAATLAIDTRTGPSDIEVTAGATGDLLVEWTAPAEGSSADAETVVRVETHGSTHRYAATPFVVEETVAPGQTSVDVSGVPVDGSRLLVTVRVGDGEAIAHQGTFADATLEDYPVCEVVWNGEGTVTLARPEHADWRHLRVVETWEEGGEQLSDVKTFAYTYSQPPGEEVIRGRTTRQSYTVALEGQDSDLWVAIEDYAGNVTAEDVSGYQRIPRPDEECVAQDLGPDLAADGRSVLGASAGEQPADGMAAHAVTVQVQDVFGNPLTGVDVELQVPEQLIVLDGAGESTVAAVATASTGTTGVAGLRVASEVAGSYTITASVAGEPVRNGQATVVFAAVPTEPPTDGTEPPTDGTEPPTDGSGPTDSPSDSDDSGTDDLPSTGAPILGPIAAAVVAVLLGTATLAWVRRRRES